jgi:hypothetical protein
MKAKIEVADRDEAKRIRIALTDPATRALVNVLGALLPLPDKRAQERILDWVSDYYGIKA